MSLLYRVYLYIRDFSLLPSKHTVSSITITLFSTINTMPSIFPLNNSEGHVCEKSVTHSERAGFLYDYRDCIGCFLLTSNDIVWRDERLQPYETKSNLFIGGFFKITYSFTWYAKYCILFFLVQYISFSILFRFRSILNLISFSYNSGLFRIT